LTERLAIGKLARLPKSVTARAEEVLEVLEKGEQGCALAWLTDDFPLFSAARRRAEQRAGSGAGSASLVDGYMQRKTPFQRRFDGGDCLQVVDVMRQSSADSLRRRTAK
jgi:hypothetical protein